MTVPSKISISTPLFPRLFCFVLFYHYLSDLLFLTLFFFFTFVTALFLLNLCPKLSHFFISLSQTDSPDSPIFPSSPCSLSVSLLQIPRALPRRHFFRFCALQSDHNTPDDTHAIPSLDFIVLLTHDSDGRDGTTKRSGPIIAPCSGDSYDLMIPPVALPNLHLPSQRLFCRRFCLLASRIELGGGSAPFSLFLYGPLAHCLPFCTSFCAGLES